MKAAPAVIDAESATSWTIGDLEAGTEYGFEVTARTMLGAISERSATTTCFTGGTRAVPDETPIDPATLASLRRHREREEAEAWERKTKPDAAVTKVKTSIQRDTSALPDVQPYTQQSTAATAEPVAAVIGEGDKGTRPPLSPVSQDEAKREEEKRQAEEWEKKKVRTMRGGVVPGLPPPKDSIPSAATTSTATARPADGVNSAALITESQPKSDVLGTAGGTDGGDCVSSVGARADVVADVDEAEAKRRAEAEAAEAWERRALTIARSGPSKPSPSMRRKEAMPPAPTSPEEDILLEAAPVTFTTGHAGGGTAVTVTSVSSIAAPQSRPRAARHDPTLDFVEEAASSSASSQAAKRVSKDEERRQAEADAAAEWERKRGVGTMKRSSEDGGRGSGRGDSGVGGGGSGGGGAATVAVDTSPGSNHAVADIGSGRLVRHATSEPAEVHATHARVSEDDDAEARREAEKERMALWESRIGKGGKVGCLSWHSLLCLASTTYGTCFFWVVLIVVCEPCCGCVKNAFSPLSLLLGPF